MDQLNMQFPSIDMGGEGAELPLAATAAAATTTTTATATLDNCLFSTFENVSFRGKEGGRILLTKKGMTYSNANEKNTSKPSIKILWKSLKSHTLNRKSLLIKLVHLQGKALIFKLPTVTDLERIHAEIAQRRDQYALDGSSDNQNASSRRRIAATRNGMESPSKGKPMKQIPKSKDDTPTKQEDSSNLTQRAVSVHYLQTVFLQEVQSAGLDPATAKIHEIEDLSGPAGVIRSKGAAVRCPIDGRMGSAYVHCIPSEDDDCVGDANYMLSYSWSYTIGDVVDTLVDFCHSQMLNKKQTYVWMCCLCVNQHRVVEKTASKSGILEESKMDFFTLFSDRVTGIGHLLALMSPWDSPSYLSRVWCVFELFTAHDTGSAISIVMPPQQKKFLEQSLFGVQGNTAENQNNGGSKFDYLYKTLARTKVQDAQASVEEDRTAILATIQNTAGYTALNHRVNELLRGWVRGVIAEIMETKYLENDLESAAFKCEVGNLLERNGEYDAALNAYEQALSIRQSLLGKDHPDTAKCMNHKGKILHQKGQRNDAIVIFEEALAICRKTVGENDLGTAVSYINIGMTLLDEGRLKDASSGILQGLEIRERLLGPDHLDMREIYSICGTLFRLRGEYETAASYMIKALNICEAKLDSYHPFRAEALNNLGVLYDEIGQHQRALVSYTRCLVIHQSVYGNDHPDTAVSHSNCGTILMQLGFADRALIQFRTALSIWCTVYGKLHFQVAETHLWIGKLFLKEKEDYVSAAVAFRNALDIYMETLGRQHKDTAICYQMLGMTLFSDGDMEGALIAYQECLQIYVSIQSQVNPNHRISVSPLSDDWAGDNRSATTWENKIGVYKAAAYSSIGQVLERQGECDEALLMTRKAYEISVSAFGRDDPQSKEYSSAIDHLLHKKWAAP